MTPESTLRPLYRSLVNRLIAAGRREEAMECARLAVKQGVWGHPLQRPLHYVPYIASVPTYDRNRLPEVAYLECHFPTIRAELDRVTDPRAAGFTSVGDSALLEGRWDQIIFYDGGRRFTHAASMFPDTAAILEGLSEETRTAGWIMFSWLQPGAHIGAHCGYSNARLRIHLGIRTPPGAHMRVKDEILTWREGECLVFDDSFEHEVRHTGTEPRVVLLVDTLHPGLRSAERNELLAQRQIDSSQWLRATMQRHRFRRVSSSAHGRLAFELEEDTARAIALAMREAGIRSAGMDVNGNLELVPENANERLIPLP